MSVTLDRLIAQRACDVPYAYTERDSMLYALAIGMGRDPLDEIELDFVYERRGRLRCVPTQAVTVARHNLIFEIGMRVEQFLHADQLLTLHRPLPTACELFADHEVVSVLDKGADRGILVRTLSRVRDRATDEPLFDLDNLYYCRGDGGIGSAGPAPVPPPRLPDRPPDLVRITETDANQALLYRLTGDRNVIHADPKIAREMGFARPILHGSATLGMACKAILASVCDHDPARIRSFGTRFSAVVYPGDRLATDIWLDGGQVSFRCRVPERDVTVLDQGRCTLAPV
jgi:acyl dehydratase